MTLIIAVVAGMLIGLSVAALGGGDFLVVPAPPQHTALPAVSQFL